VSSQVRPVTPNETNSADAKSRAADLQRYPYVVAFYCNIFAIPKAGSKIVISNSENWGVRWCIHLTILSKQISFRTDKQNLSSQPSGNIYSEKIRPTILL